MKPIFLILIIESLTVDNLYFIFCQKHINYSNKFIYFQSTCFFSCYQMKNCLLRVQYKNKYNKVCTLFNWCTIPFFHLNKNKEYQSQYLFLLDAIVFSYYCQRSVVYAPPDYHFFSTNKKILLFTYNVCVAAKFFSIFKLAKNPLNLMMNSFLIVD